MVKKKNQFSSTYVKGTAQTGRLASCKINIEIKGESQQDDIPLCFSLSWDLVLTSL